MKGTLNCLFIETFTVGVNKISIYLPTVNPSENQHFKLVFLNLLKSTVKREHWNYFWNAYCVLRENLHSNQ